MRRNATTVLGYTVIIAAIAPAAVLARRQAPQTQSPPVFASAVVGVRVDVLVADASTDRPIGGLKAGDFELRDNGVVQHVEVSDLADMPVNVVLAFDASGSIVGKRLTDLQSATHRLLGDLQPADRVALTTFNHAVSPRLALGSDARSVGAVVDALAPSGATSLIDGIYVSLMSAHAETGRSFVLVCTDGRDTASWLTPDELLESAKRAPAVVYVVASSGRAQVVAASRRDERDRRPADRDRIERPDRRGIPEDPERFSQPLRADVHADRRRARRLPSAGRAREAGPNEDHGAARVLLSHERSVG